MRAVLNEFFGCFGVKYGIKGFLGGVLGGNVGGVLLIAIIQTLPGGSGRSGMIGSSPRGTAAHPGAHHSRRWQSTMVYDGGQGQLRVGCIHYHTIGGQGSCRGGASGGGGDGGGG